MQKPPGPQAPLTLAELRQKNPLQIFPDFVKTYGNVVFLEMNGAPTVLLNEPDLIQQVMVKDYNRFCKGSLWWIGAVMGEGVGVSEGQAHKRQRKMLAPAFTARGVEAYAPDILEIGLKHASSWTAGVHHMPGILGEMTLHIVYRTLLGCELDDGEAVEIREAFKITQKSSGLMAAREDQVPADALAEFRQAMARLEGALQRLLEAHRGRRGGDILSHLMTLHDEEQQGFSDKELRDQALSIMLAGHDTTADALGWTFHLLSLHPEVQEQACQEALALEGDPKLADLPRLGLCWRIFSEAMRLYPPIWMISRQTTDSYQLGDYTLEPGTYVRMSPYITHRDERFFPDPERFKPDRWLPAEVAKRPRFSYYPFGGGNRVCLGEPMAWMEGPLLMATLLRRWRFVADRPVQPLPLITLSAHDLYLRLEARA